MQFCAVLGTHPSDTPGGAELQAQLICAELAERGHESTYVAFDAATQGVTDHDGVAVHRLDTGGALDTVSRLRETVDRIDPDVLYLRNLSDIPFSLLFRFATDAHVVYNVSHDVQCLPRFAGWPGKPDRTIAHTVYRRAKLGFRRSFLPVPDTLFVQTERQRRLLERNRGLSGHHTGNGHPVPESPPEKHDPPVVLWLASIKPWKRPERFVEVARRCRDIDCEFWLVGRPAERALADRVAEAADRLPNLRYLGGCTVAESDEYVERASVFVNTSIQEGFPNTFIQSWFRRTPVVSLTVDPVGATGEHPTGYYALGDVGTVTDRVRALITDPQRRRALGQRAFEYAREHNDIRRVVDRIEAGLPDTIVDRDGRVAGDRPPGVPLDQ